MLIIKHHRGRDSLKGKNVTMTRKYDIRYFSKLANREFTNSTIIFRYIVIISHLLFINLSSYLTSLSTESQ